jgi:hypothetical protein
MQEHRFKVGRRVHFTPGAANGEARSGNYDIVRLLPAEGSENQYRIKSATDGHERVARESQLD